MNRAWSLFEIKSIDEESRTFDGIATTISTDRGEDIVDPAGAVFKLPLTMLWQHGKGAIKDAIGWIEKAEVGPKHIRVQGRFAKPKADYPQGLRDELDGAWVKVRDRIVRGLSIGFKPLDEEPIKGSYGTLYKRWEWLELSPVNIAMNADASITSVKSVDQQLRAASGEKEKRVVRLDPSPGATGTQRTGLEPVFFRPEQGKDMKTTAEQIASFEAKRQASVGRMDAVMQKANDEGRSFDETETQEYDGLSAEVRATDEHIARLKAHEAIMVAKAVPVRATVEDQPQAGTQARQGIVVMGKDTLPPGIEFARYVKCLAAAKGNLMQAYEISKTQYPDQTRIHTVLKAAVAAGTTTDTTWAAPLVDYQNFAGDFIEFLRPQTIIGQFGTNGIPSLRRVPFNITIPSQTSGGAAYWVGEGAPKPLTKFDFASTNLRWSKVAAIAVLTDELVRFSSPSADMLVRDALAAAVIERIDIDFIDPDKAEVTNVSPASITNGVAALATAGSSAANARTDVRNIFASYITNNLSPANGVWIMSSTTALALSMMQNALGQPENPDLTMRGGRFAGLPVIVSQYVKASGSPTETLLILANASDIYLADDGQVVIDASREASLQMLDNPTNNSATGTATTMVSMFQTNSVAVRAERFINWKVRRAAAVAYVENVAYAPA